VRYHTLLALTRMTETRVSKAAAAAEASATAAASAVIALTSAAQTAVSALALEKSATRKLTGRDRLFAVHAYTLLDGVAAPEPDAVFSSWFFAPPCT
jgi:hypothetical protein